MEREGFEEKEEYLLVNGMPESREGNTRNLSKDMAEPTDASKLMDKPTIEWFDDFERISKEVKLERRLQDQKWGEQNHHPVWWMAILGEEVGESQKAVLESCFGEKPWMEYRAELIQVAAVAIAAVQCLDRNKEPQKPKSKDGAEIV